MVYLGYILLGIAINGFFGIYLPNKNPGTPSWAWGLLAIIGISIIGVKTLKLPKKKKFNAILADVIFVSILTLFALISLPCGINFIIGSVLAVFYLYYVIVPRFLHYI